MDQTQFQRQAQRFELIGAMLNAPADGIARPGFFPFLRNVRAVQMGGIQNRPGHTAIDTAVAGQADVHSIRRLNDTPSADWTYVLGAGTKLTTGQTTQTERDSGYSGNPLSLIPYTPPESIEPWMLVGDSNKMRKVKRDGTVHQLGLPAPTTDLDPYLDIPKYKILDRLNQRSAGNWVADATIATALNSPNTGNYRVDTTVTRVATAGNIVDGYTVQPASMKDIGVGMELTFNPGAGEISALVHEVHRGSGATTIAAILYESGSTGRCSVHLTTPVPVEEGSLIEITGGVTESCVVLSVHEHPDGTKSFVTITANTQVAGRTVTLYPSFRVYTSTFPGVQVADVVQTRSNNTGELGSRGLQANFAAGKGTISRPLPATVDASIIATGVPTNPEDFLHISVRAAAPKNIREVRILLDVDRDSVSAGALTASAFVQNYYMAVFSGDDLVQALDGSQSVRNVHSLAGARGPAGINRLNRDFLGSEDTLSFSRPGDPYSRNPFAPSFGPYGNGPWMGGDPHPLGGGTGFGGALSGGSDPTGFGTPPANPHPVELGTGQNQYSELRIPIAMLKRVGTDLSRGLESIVAIQLWAECEGTGSTIIFDSLWIGGGYGPSIPPGGVPYYYRYRGRCSSTGVRSNWSPPSRYGVRPSRGRVAITPGGLTHATTEVDKLDIQRFGGAILEWRHVMTVDNNPGAVVYDILDDLAVEANAAVSEGNTNFQPFPTQQAPASGTADTVAGVFVYDASAVFDTSWAQHTLIDLEDASGAIHTYSIFRVHSTTLIELYQSAKSGSNVAWTIDRPVKVGQPLAHWWGPFENFYFACGDLKNPGRLYITNGNNPDSTQAHYYIDVTSGSETLMNGCTHDTRAYLFSSERMFAILPDFTLPNLFRVVPIPGVKGLFARWALAVDDEVYVLSEDGIYSTTGGGAKDITSDALRPLFRQSGVAGVDTNSVRAPLLTGTLANRLRLTAGGGRLYFDLITQAANYAQWMYDTKTGGWLLDTLGLNEGIAGRYIEEGVGAPRVLVGTTDTAKFGYIGGNDDFGVSYPCEFRPPSFDFGDPRSQKKFGDVWVDGDTAGLNVTLTPGVNAHSTTLAAATMTQSGRGTKVVDIGSGVGALGRNISLHFSWTHTGSGTEVFYSWQPSFVPQAEDTFLRGTEWTDFGVPGDKHLRALILEADTDNSSRTIEIQRDGGTLIETLTVQYNGRRQEVFGITPPAVGRLFRLLPTDANSWRHFGWIPVYDKYADRSDALTPWTDAGYAGDKWMQGIRLCADTEGASVDVVVQYDDGATGPTLTINHALKSTKTYPFATALIGRNFRLVPQSACRLFMEESEWVYTPIPDKAHYWIPQRTSFGWRAFGHIKEIELAYQCNTTVLVKVSVDGAAVDTYTVASAISGGKAVVPVLPKKGRLFQITIEASNTAVAASLRLYKDDCVVRANEWGRPGYAEHKLFGDSNQGGIARV